MSEDKKQPQKPTMVNDSMKDINKLKPKTTSSNTNSDKKNGK